VTEAGPRRPSRFERAFPVAAADIDELGHVNNVVYLRWVQEIAVAHWRAAAPAELQAEVVWVVLRHELDYKRPARAGDVVVGRTWVGEATGSRFERFTEFVRGAEPEVLAHARSVWCPLNARTGRPRRIDPALHDYFSEPASP
jgi:acyl-CoA thioester hydrolase